ncbi:S9 family peptidase [Flavobacterium jejuense]|uniref:S9 family peptidase n=1 Tax=Flavobacterium jejuense TaxID=1544455 RepID=A0ABX0IPN9_9FLAO|nr:prolyl oligopeptidase family serine peptidase [Flavobacterium jejuense]NHN25775.1 S9 family peptidase [Flavobacterium jejuense]
MKYLKLVVVILALTTSCYAQEQKLLLKKELFSDYSKLPFYSKITEEINGTTTWIKNYKFLDSISIFKIQYLSDGLKVNGFIIEPKIAKKVPCIIFNRGGNRDFGNLTVNTAFRLGKLANEGYVVIASQYRGNGGSEGKEEFGGKDINDVLALIDVLKEVDIADTERIGMYGWSRGGMMTYIALTKTDKIKAAVVGGAPSSQYESIKDRPGMEKEVLADLIPEYEKNKEIELYKRSPVKWANQFSKDVPILILHGTSDWRVRPEQSLNMAQEFTKYRIPYRLIMFEGGDHGILEFREEVEENIINWFDKYLRKGKSLPNMEFHGK